MIHLAAALTALHYLQCYFIYPHVSLTGIYILSVCLKHCLCYRLYITEMGGLL